MNWSVTYRAKNGSPTVDVFEAESRGALFKVLADKGISAIKIEEGARERPRAKAHCQSPKIVRGIVAGAAVVGLAFTAWYLLATRTESPNPKTVSAPKKPSKIVEVRPAISRPKPVEEKVEPPKPDPNARPTKVGEVVNGYVLLPSGRLHRRQGVITNSVASRAKGAYHIFDHACDNEIACYLSIKPGDSLVGPARYTGRFKDKFLESLKTPIIVTQDDTPEQAQLKRDVIAAKLELKDALDRGEDIEQIMLDTRQELQDLARYKMELRKQFHEMRRTEGSKEEDVETLLEACNKMLESRGIAPMKFGPITRRKLISEMESQE